MTFGRNQSILHFDDIMIITLATICMLTGILAHTCEVGKEKTESNEMKWNKPISDTCKSSRPLILGGMNTVVPRKPTTTHYTDDFRSANDQQFEIGPSNVGNVKPTKREIPLNEPTSTEKGTTSEEPTTAEKETTSEEPTTTEKETTSEEPTTTEKETTAEDPSTFEKGTTNSPTSATSLSSTSNLENCNDSLGMENGAIPDANIVASSEFTSLGFNASKARLNNKPLGSYWSPAKGDTSNWIQADIGYQTYVSGVITQGDGGHSQEDWVTSFNIATMLLLSDDPNYITDVGKSIPKEFPGNTDGMSTKQIRLPAPVFARVVRIVCLGFGGNFITLRFEIKGCIH